MTIKPHDDEPATSPMSRGVRNHIAVTNPDAALAELLRENDYLADVIAEMEKRVPSAEEMAYLRNRKEQDEHAAWVIKLLRANAGWIFVLLGVIGSAVYWFFTHTISIKGNQ